MSEETKLKPYPRSACCSCPIRVISAPSESFLLCDACGEECSLLTVEQAEQEYKDAPEIPLTEEQKDRIARMPELVREAYEAGFNRAVSYGDNFIHADLERDFNKWRERKHR